MTTLAARKAAAASGRRKPACTRRWSASEVRSDEERKDLGDPAENPVRSISAAILSVPVPRGREGARDVRAVR